MSTDTPGTGTVTKSESITTPDQVATKLPQSVEIRDVGPCKKHVKVTVDRAAIDARFDEKFSELVQSDQSYVSGFRPGKAPRKIIERRYKREVASEIKTEVLMASLEQLAEEQAISPLSPPELDPHAIVIPNNGPFIYEFDIEVRPEFDLPDYKNLKLRRPVHTFTDEDVEKETTRVLAPLGQIVPKEDQVVALDDMVTADVVISRDGKELNTLEEVRVKVEERLALQDGVAEDFGTTMTGAKPGDSRTVDIVLSQEISNPTLRGTKVQATFTVKEVKTVKQPELSADILDYFGVRTAEQFSELIRVRLERQLEYTQRQTARTQVLEKLAGDAQWELPQDLLKRQARKTLARRVMEMRSSGMSDEQILGRQRMLEMDTLRSTASALKEHFVLQKIAEDEKLEIEDADIEAEIEAIAERTGESYRKVRARMEKEDLIEALATDLLERKALDLILSSAEYEDYEMNPTERGEGDVATVSQQAMPAGHESETPADEASEEKPATS